MIASDLSVNSSKREYNEYCKKLYDILENDNKENDYSNKCCQIIDEATNNRQEELNYKYNNMTIVFNVIIDRVTWWIPIRKWRDNFRNKFNNLK